MNGLVHLVSGHPGAAPYSVFDAGGGGAGELRGIVFFIAAPIVVATLLAYPIVQRIAEHIGWPPDVFSRLPAAAMVGTLSYPVSTFISLYAVWPWSEGANWSSFPYITVMGLIASLGITLPTYIVVGPTFILYCKASAKGGRLLPDFTIYALVALSICAQYFYLKPVLN